LRALLNLANIVLSMKRWGSRLRDETRSEIFQQRNWHGL